MADKRARQKATAYQRHRQYSEAPSSQAPRKSKPNAKGRSDYNTPRAVPAAWEGTNTMGSYRVTSQSTLVEGGLALNIAAEGVRKRQKQMEVPSATRKRSQCSDKPTPPGMVEVPNSVQTLDKECSTDGNQQAEPPAMLKMKLSRVLPRPEKFKFASPPGKQECARHRGDTGVAAPAHER